MTAESMIRVPGSTRIESRAAWLTKHADYQRVYREGRRQSLPLMAYFYALRRPGEAKSSIDTGPLGSRVGLTAGKVLGNAVERNRIKRRMRAAVQRHRAKLTAGVDLILHPRRTVLEAKFIAIEREVEQILCAVQAAADAAQRSGCDLPGQPLQDRKRTATGKSAALRAKIPRKATAKPAGVNSTHAD